MKYERLIEDHKDAVYRQMVRVCGNHDDAEDALVEALLSAYKAIDQLRDEANFRAWLAMIGRRVCTRIKRREALLPIMQFSQFDPGQLPEVPSEEPNAEEAAAGRDLHECIIKAIDSLPDLYREVYLLREIQGLEAPEVSEKLDLSIPAIKSRLHRARAMVRTTLDSELCTASLN